MKRIDSEIFSIDDGHNYLENQDTWKDTTYIDGEKFGNRQASIAAMVYDSIGLATNNDVESFNFFKEHEIENLVTIWHKDGNSFVAKGYFVVKETGAKYPFAFEFNAGYMITQEWYGRDTKI